MKRLAPSATGHAFVQNLRRGQVLGKLGNSGNTTAPHMHIQVRNAVSALGSDGLPTPSKGSV